MDSFANPHSFMLYRFICHAFNNLLPSIFAGVLMLRHPADAIRSYRDVRYELAYSSDWAESHARKEYTYSYEGPMEHFYWWKQDGGFIQEMKLWSWFIDFWMEEGWSRNKDHELVRTKEVSYEPKQYKVIGYNYENQIGVNTQFFADEVHDVIDNIPLNCNLIISRHG